MINLFNIDDDSNFKYMLDTIGRTVTVNRSTTPIKAAITNMNNNAVLNASYDDRRISTIDVLNRGDLIDWNNKKYMVISEMNDKRYAHYKGIIRHLTHMITFSSKCRFESVHAYIDNGNPSFKSGNVLTLIQEKIVVFVPMNTMNLTLDSGDEFMIQGNKFKIVVNDTYSESGIGILTCERTQINPAIDDKIHNIANGLGCPINITNNEPVTMLINSTLQLAWTSTENAPVTFITSDDNIATVDAVGLVTGNVVGLVTITVRNATNGFIYDTVDINVEDVPEVKTIVITAEPNYQSGDYISIDYSQSATFTATVYDGLVPTSDTVTLQLFADNKTSAVDMTKFTKVINGNAIQITAKNTGYYMQLMATSIDDPSIFTWQRIRIKSLF